MKRTITLLLVSLLLALLGCTHADRVKPAEVTDATPATPEPGPTPTHIQNFSEAQEKCLWFLGDEYAPVSTEGDKFIAYNLNKRVFVPEAIPENLRATVPDEIGGVFLIYDDAKQAGSYDNNTFAMQFYVKVYLVDPGTGVVMNAPGDTLLGGSPPQQTARTDTATFGAYPDAEAFQSLIKTIVQESYTPMPAAFKTQELEDNTVAITANRLLGKWFTGFPAEVGGKPVSAIMISVRTSMRPVGVLTVPDAVKIIWDGAFQDCDELAGISLPKNLDYIGHGAFQECRQLDTVIPKFVSTIGNFAFEGCFSLTCLDLSGGALTTLGNYAFSACTSLERVILPGTLATVQMGAFDSCKALTFLELGEGITMLEEYAFADCEALTSVTLPESLTYIGFRAFNDCSALAVVTVPDSVTIIENEAFDGCASALTIRCHVGSYAEKYARKNQIQVELIEDKADSNNT